MIFFRPGLGRPRTRSRTCHYDSTPEYVRMNLASGSGISVQFREIQIFDRPNPNQKMGQVNFTGQVNFYLLSIKFSLAELSLSTIIL